ncbi:MAG: RNA polymerase sigma factor [Candidatus Nanopelagicaceae bacterium]|nr:sigma-70 family RNA polymerase sigma factor [Actinomycetales bacterium]
MEKRTLAQLIAALPEEERVILMLYFVKNLSIAEIAAKIGVPERSVRTVLESGRSRLRSTLDFPSSD